MDSKQVMVVHPKSRPIHYSINMYQHLIFGPFQNIKKIKDHICTRSILVNAPEASLTLIQLRSEIQRLPSVFYKNNFMLNFMKSAAISQTKDPNRVVHTVCTASYDRVSIDQKKNLVQILVSVLAAGAPGFPGPPLDGEITLEYQVE